MKIGIDIDNVISNFNDILLKEYLNHDKQLRNTGIINKDIFMRYGMFDWTDEEENNFYKTNIERIAQSLNPLTNCKYFIDKLKADGNEIYIISGRNNGEYTNPEEMTKSWLNKYNIYYDKLILTNAYDKQAKSVECIKYKIDVMIEDSTSTCIDLKKNGIKVLIMNTRYNQNATQFERVNSWRDIYPKISNMYQKQENTEKINVILDTDTYNECDDQFALSYVIKSQDRFNIEAITVAPYRHDNDISIEEGLEKSYNEILKISNWLNFNTENKVFKGSIDYISDGYNETNEAVEKIIEIALKNDKTYIMAIGAITNIAMAISKEPKIIEKIEIIWLGGNSPFYKDNNEFNFRQDIEAVQTIFNSKVKLIVIPCKPVASNLVISIFELEHYLKDKNEVCNYLCDRFYNDGIHGIQTRRPIWDISAIAYLINKEWFEEKEINCPNINKDISYELDTNNHKVKFVNYLNAELIYKDLFKKLGE